MNIIRKLFVARRRGLLITIALVTLACLVALPSVYALQRSTAYSAVTVPSNTHGVILSTNVSGTITTNTTWSPSGSPYIVTGDVTVAAGVTLTVEGGVQVQFAQFAGLRVLGTLTAVGTAAAPILFTGTTQQPGWWEGITIDGAANTPLTGSAFDYVTVEYGGQNSSANLYAEYATVPVAHSSFRFSSHDGLQGGFGALFTISDSSFTNNTDYALQFLDGSLNQVLARLTIADNGTNAIASGAGALAGIHLWENVGVPYVITGDQLVAGGASLTIEPGVQARFAQFAGLRVQGTITAVGTAAAPILFTGTTQQPGWWEGITIDGAQASPLTGSVFDYVTVEYGGQNGSANLYAEYATVPVAHSVFRFSSRDGLQGGFGGLFTISDSSFTNNTNYPLQFLDGSLNQVLAGVTVSDNGTNAIASGGGTLVGTHLWENVGVPYVVTGDQLVGAGAILTIEPGVQARFAQFAGLRIQGTLTAVGTATQPLLFTGTSQQPGWWEGITLDGGAASPLTSSAFDYVTVEYGGQNGTANLYAEYATVPVAHSVFRFSSRDGLQGGFGGRFTISDSSFTNNADYAVQFLDGSINQVLTRLTITNNGINAIASGGGTLTGTHLWENVGVPYVITGDQLVTDSASLTIEPGGEIRFGQFVGLRIQGTLRANGNPTAPIIFTGTTPQPGWWEGITIDGAQARPTTSAEISYARIEYGGQNGTGNVYVEYGVANIYRSVLRQSSRDGVYIGFGGAGSVIEASQIIENAGAGVRNADPQNAMLAANNWWGAASGPTYTGDGNCNAGGTGSVITPGIVFRPFLTSADADPGPVAPADVRVLTLTPRRWFVPADGSTRLFVQATLRDGNGRALSGRQIRVASTLGSVTDGGITDLQGQTFASLRSSQAGDAQLTASLDGRTVCEFARSSVTKVTFSSQADSGLTPDAQAPYVNEGIQITPMPITRGVPTKLSATLKNPNSFPIIVDAQFGFAQAGIGLVFGPVGEVLGKEIPANGEGVVEIIWTPSVSGHYCVQLEYNFRAKNGLSVLQSGRSQRNLNVYSGPLGSPSDKDALNKAQNAINVINKVPGGKQIAIPKAGVNALIGWQFSTAREISKNLGGDPPRLDYKILAQPEKPPFTPLVPDSEVSAARAAAINALVDAQMDVFAFGNAATISLDRYGGAAEARDLTWASQQTAALLFYQTEFAKAAIRNADALEALLAVVRAEGGTDVIITLADVQAYQERLRTQGYNADELAAARSLGLTDAQIEAERQLVLAADPVIGTGSSFDYLQTIATRLRVLGNEILTPTNFGGISIGGGGGLVLQADEPNNLVRVYGLSDTLQIGNPTGQTATIDMRVRNIDLPPDWLVSVTPITPTLAPGATTTVTVEVRAGTPAPQGVTPRLAVEGYIGDQLIGGVAIDVVLPQRVFFDGKYRTYLPTVRR